MRRGPRKGAVQAAQAAGRPWGLLGALLLLFAAPGRAQVRDTALRWHELHTDHFIIAYHEPLGAVARRAAQLCEEAHARVSDALDSDVSDTVHVVLTDGTDSANGSATSLPYNTIRLFATAPEDISTLGDTADWLELLIDHEHTHVVHLDTVHGVPNALNHVLGKVLAPNLVQPRWFIEGLATYRETEDTSGGRLRSTMFQMFLRMDALEGRMLDIDELSNIVDRWPRGNSWYIYGAHFVEFIARRHGDASLARMGHNYGGRLIPYGINRVAQEATGSTFTDLYERWRDEERGRAAAFAARVAAEGLVEGERLTYRGDIARSPRWVGNNSIVYFVNSQGLDSQLRRIRTVPRRSLRSGRELVRAAGTAYLAPDGEGGLVYSALDGVSDIYVLYDLFHRSADGEVTRLTEGQRARGPDVHEGRIVFSQNGAGTSHLMIADLEDIEGTAQPLLRNPRFGQIYTPRFSPDGRSVAYSRWNDGHRDVQIIDVASGRVTRVTQDRAIDSGPAWAPDGRSLYFSSDRTGVANLYRYDLETRALHQVTNVIAGAYSPDVSPDGRTIAYVGYTSYGFDIWRLDLDEVEERPAPPYRGDRAAPRTYAQPTMHAQRYRAGRTLYPRSYALDLQSTTLGSQLGIRIAQTDIGGHYTYDVRMGIGLEGGEVDLSGSFSFQRPRAPIRLGAFRRLRERNDLIVAGQRRSWLERSAGFDMGVSYPFLRAFHTNTLSASYGLTWTDNQEPLGGRLDPNTPPPSIPERGRFSTLRVGWSYSDVRARLFDMTPSEGRSLRTNISLSHQALREDHLSAAFTWSWRRFVSFDALPGHSLAFRYGGGVSVGARGRRRLFGVGGFPGGVLNLDGILDGSTLGGVALRGYPVNSRVGTQSHLLQTEYRLPLFRTMQGIQTLPVYLTRVHAAVFVDVGDAYFDRIDPSAMRVGAGVELFADVHLAYVLEFQFRLGLAYGFMDGGGVQAYFHLGTPF
ncbi:MAG: hypothetical protein AAF938_17045 [Myxococcota bacterium]